MLPKKKKSKYRQRTWQSLTDFPTLSTQSRMIANWFQLVRSRWPRCMKSEGTRLSRDSHQMKPLILATTCISGTCSLEAKSFNLTKLIHLSLQSFWKVLVKTFPTVSGQFRKTWRTSLSTCDVFLGQDFKLFIKWTQKTSAASISGMALRTTSYPLWFD